MEACGCVRWPRHWFLEPVSSNLELLLTGRMSLCPSAVEAGEGMFGFFPLIMIPSLSPLLTQERGVDGT